ncbi:MAG: DUF2142 domain-containing protein [Candidatus Sericytochromatia bacterium]|nr:DUF2142 domain-containing protein [Candidatus Tanganyikabacteria bacterium]
MHAPTPLASVVRPQTGWLGIVLAFVMVKQLAWLAAVPLWQSPDEPAHFHYVQYLAETDRLPRFDRSRSTNVSSPEAAYTERQAHLNDAAFHADQRPVTGTSAMGPGEERLAQSPPLDRMNDGNSTAAPYPPAYYALAAGVYRFFGDEDILTRVFAVRALSTVFVLVTVLLAWLLAGELWPQPFIRAAFALIVGSQPMLSLMGVSVNNDAMLVAAASGLAWLLLRAWRVEPGFGSGALMGLCLGVAWLTKPQGMALAPFVPLVTAGFAWHSGRSPGSWLRVMAGAAAGTTLLVGPWLWHLQQAYGTSLPALGGLSPTPLTTLPKYLAEHVLQPGLSRTHTLWVEQYWGAFGWLDTRTYDLAYRIAEAFMWVGAFGAWRLARRGTAAQRAILAACLVLTAGFLAALYAAEYQVVRGTGIPMLQGRYLLPVVLPHVLLAFVGCLGLAGPQRRMIVAGWLAAGAVALQALGLLRVLERYYA